MRCSHNHHCWNLSKQDNQHILDLYLQCWTQERIAEEIGVDFTTISKIISNLKNGNIAKNQADFKPELYNIWNFAKITNETQHPEYLEYNRFYTRHHMYPDRSTLRFLFGWFIKISAAKHIITHLNINILLHYTKTIGTVLVQCNNI